MSNEPRNFSEKGIVLKTNPYREADLIISLLCESTGRIAAIARGARNSKKRFVGGINPLDCALFELEKPKREGETLYSLRGAHDHKPHLGLRKSLPSYTAASFCLEVAELLIPEGERGEEELYALLFRTISALDTSSEKEKVRAIICYYVLSMLRWSGLDPMEEQRALEKSTLEWWQLMIHESRPRKPKAPEDSASSLLYFSGALEEFAKVNLRSKQATIRACC